MSIFTKQNINISSDTLRLLAAVFMLFDHMRITLFPNILWLHIIGRLAFPIYAFFIAEGYTHTSNVKKYALRLFVFGIISEIPFNFLIAGVPFYPYRQSVMLTLLLGLVLIAAVDNAEKNPSAKNISLAAAALALCCALARLIASDYREYGVLTVLCFFLFRSFKPGQIISMLLLHVFLFEGMALKAHIFGKTVLFSSQGFAVFALLPIWLCNGKRRINGRLPHTAIYLFYPAHMLILHLLRCVLK